MEQLRQDRLFVEDSLTSLFDRRRYAMKKEFDKMTTEYILGVSDEKLSKYFLGTYMIDTPELLDEEIYIYEYKETKMDVSQDPLRPIRDRSRPFYIDGFIVTMAIPFTGDADLFRYTPSRFNSSPPMATVADNELKIQYVGESIDDEKIKRITKGILDDVKWYLNTTKADVEKYNSEIEKLAKDMIASRKERFHQAQSKVALLGFPLKKRENNLTYVVPTLRKKVGLIKPTVEKDSSMAEPILADDDYKHILKVIQNMVLVMERSPRAFARMGEEDLRQHFLVQLNGQYEGQATGETFNFEGKTDILIRVNGKNIFIAECKFWHGEEAFSDTINQLLGYLSWRDSKTAILIFNRNIRFSEVIEKANKTVCSHPMYVKTIDQVNETVYRYIFRQPQDDQKHLYLTLMLFNIPQDNKG